MEGIREEKVFVRGDGIFQQTMGEDDILPRNFLKLADLFHQNHSRMGDHLDPQFASFCAGITEAEGAFNADDANR